MNEAAGMNAEQSVSEDKQGTPLPILTQAGLWALPFVLGVTSILLIGLILSVARAGGTARPAMRLLLLVGLPYGVLILWPAAAILLRKIRRKKRTGWFLPSSEELASRWARAPKLRPLWRRSAATALYGSMSIGYTFIALGSTHDQDLEWTFAAFMWTIAVQVAAMEFLPHVPRPVSEEAGTKD